MDTTTLTSREAIMYVALINAGIGLLLGLIPLVAGFFKHRVKLGLAGLVCSVIGGAIFGVLLSVPIAALFAWLIIRDSNHTSAETN